MLTWEPATKPGRGKGEESNVGWDVGSVLRGARTGSRWCLGKIISWAISVARQHMQQFSRSAPLLLIRCALQSVPGFRKMPLPADSAAPEFGTGSSTECYQVYTPADIVGS